MNGVCTGSLGSFRENPIEHILRGRQYAAVLRVNSHIYFPVVYGCLYANAVGFASRRSGSCLSGGDGRLSAEHSAYGENCEDCDII